MKFTDLPLNPNILKALEAMGYTELTPIQEQTFPHILEGRDLLATAETGSGKTSACGVPLVQKIDLAHGGIQVLVMVPTRELALQYVEEIDRIAHFDPVVPFAVYGGFDIDVQRAKLQDGVHILVATPGRLIDLLYSGHLSLSQVRTVVLDEADEMLKLGFLEDIDLIFSCLLQEHQTMLFSATMPAEIRRMADRYLKDPVVIQLNREQVAPESLEHHFLLVPRAERLGTLKQYLKSRQVIQAIVFSNSRDGAERLFRELKGLDRPVDLIHGGLEQAKRTSIIRRFRGRGIHVMVATDVAGRGLDFTRVSHIINYDFPRTPEIYTHRTGRTGRMGRQGVALTLVNRSDLRSLNQILRTNHIQPVWEGAAPDLGGNDGRQAGASTEGRAPTTVEHPRPKPGRGPGPAGRRGRTSDGRGRRRRPRSRPGTLPSGSEPGGR
jgi:ATP-dependent RNA helicase DeaD